MSIFNPPVTISGTPANNQMATWTSASVIEGTPRLTDDGVGITITPASGSNFTANLSGAGSFILANVTTDQDVRLNGRTYGLGNLQYRFQAARGTQAAPTAMVAGLVAEIFGDGYDGTTYRPLARIRINSDGTVTSTSSPGTLLFDTTPSGSITLTERMRITAAGALLFGDTANANNTAGFTINQRGADDHGLTIKSSDVATAATSVSLSVVTETDDYFAIAKTSGIDGGADLVGLAGSSGASSFRLEGWSGAPATTDTPTSLAAMIFMVGQHNGANGRVNMAADSNGFAWGEIDSLGARQTRMLLKADDGELHLGNTTLVALDAEDDIALVRAMQWETSGGAGMKTTPWDTTDYGVPPFSYEKLHAIGVLGERDASGNCLFRVQPRFAMNEGAIWQLYVRILKDEKTWQHELHLLRDELRVLQITQSCK